MVALLLLAHPLHAEVDAGSRTPHTPYDSYMGNMQRAYAKMGSNQPSIDQVRSNLRTARRFRYFFDKNKPYVPQPPEVTEAKKMGDCKAKSLWLAVKMDNGKTRFVIGQASKKSKIAHAWLLWFDQGRYWILDPTTHSEMVAAEKVAGKRWYSRYSYDRAGAYKHSSYAKYFKD